MSWQTYVDTNLVGSGKVIKAAIIGQKGGVWASTLGYNLSLDEQKAVVEGFTNPAKVQASGLRLASQKFFTLQANDRSIYGKKASDGVVAVKTVQAILIAEYVTPTQAPEAISVVESLADYLISVGY